jgi:hypothetical protein
VGQLIQDCHDFRQFRMVYPVRLDNFYSQRQQAFKLIASEAMMMPDNVSDQIRESPGRRMKANGGFFPGLAIDLSPNENV